MAEVTNLLLSTGPIKNKVKCKQLRWCNYAGAGRQGWFTFSIRNTRFDKRALNIFITSCPLIAKKTK